MSHNTRYAHTLDKQSRQADRTQLNRLRRTNPQQALGNEDWIEESRGKKYPGILYSEDVWNWVFQRETRSESKSDEE